MSFSLKKALLMFNLFDSVRMDFYEDFAAALQDGAPDVEHLKKLAKRARIRRTGRASLYELWLKKMKRMTFSRAMQGTVPDHEVMVLTASEEDGRLPEGMRFLARSIKTSGSIKAAYFMSLVSPVLGLVMVLGFLASYALMIAPIYLQTIPLSRWPVMSSILYHTSTGLVSNWFSLAIGAVLAVIAIRWTRPNWKGSFRAKVDRIPVLPWKTYRRNQSINFLVTLAILLQSNNHGMKESLQRMKSLASPWLAWNINLMLKRLELTPDFPAKALDIGFFEPSLMDRIEDYSERSDFFTALSKLAFEQSDRFVKQAEKNAIFAGMVGLVMVASVLIFVVLANAEMNTAIESSMAAIR